MLLTPEHTGSKTQPRVAVIEYRASEEGRVRIGLSMRTRFSTMASRLVFAGSAGTIADTRRRTRWRRKRINALLAARGRVACMRLRRGVGPLRQRFRYPIVRSQPRPAFHDLRDLHS